MKRIARARGGGPIPMQRGVTRTTAEGVVVAKEKAEGAIAASLARLPQLESLGLRLPCFASLLPRENIRTCLAAAARSLAHAALPQDPNTEVGKDA